MANLFAKASISGARQCHSWYIRPYRAPTSPRSGRRRLTRRARRLQRRQFPRHRRGGRPPLLDAEVSPPVEPAPPMQRPFLGGATSPQAGRRRRPRRARRQQRLRLPVIAAAGTPPWTEGSVRAESPCQAAPTDATRVLGGACSRLANRRWRPRRCDACDGDVLSVIATATAVREWRGRRRPKRPAAHGLGRVVRVPCCACVFD